MAHAAAVSQSRRSRGSVGVVSVPVPAGSVSGRRTSRRVPGPSGRSWMVIRPRCRAICWATSVSPRPEPGLSGRRWKRSKTAVRSSGAMPGPRSSTVITAAGMSRSRLRRSVTSTRAVPSSWVRPCTRALVRRLSTAERSPCSQPWTSRPEARCVVTSAPGCLRRRSAADPSISSARSTGPKVSSSTRSPCARALSITSMPSSRACSCCRSASTSVRSPSGSPGWPVRMSRLVRMLIRGLRSSCEAAAAKERAVASASWVLTACSS